MKKLIPLLFIPLVSFGQEIYYSELDTTKVELIDITKYKVIAPLEFKPDTIKKMEKLNL